ncbi:hypothetical protein COMNV_01175 [Commensalibacter sp. Nvir]|uniref:DUF6290 family protein n=1 Tax=Commensalibacter sp. Nvir TaxID=3069817 RepID=UPI002D556A5B|nr:hypothetical protein COMNV_01175 [Commensalibacter sp. Nvir]
MSMLTIRVDDHVKNQLQEIAKLKKLSLSGLVLSAVNEMIENEFDTRFVNKIERQRNPKEPHYDIHRLYKEFDLED